jgi:hypothetical protein
MKVGMEDDDLQGSGRRRKKKNTGKRFRSPVQAEKNM